MNIHDIAREAGVSIATVSRVLNNSDKVQESTRRRIQEIIDKRSYTPNDLARGLLRQRTRSIGVLTVDILNPYYATVIHSIEQNLHYQGYYAFLCNTGESHREILQYIHTLLEKRVDGLIFVGSVYKDINVDDYIVNAASKVPVVMVNSIIDAPNVFCIVSNDRLGIKQTIETLIQQGRKSILFLNTLETQSGRNKQEAFVEVLQAHADESIQWEIIETGIPQLSKLPDIIKSFYRKRFFATILAADDLFANIAVNTLHYLQIAIPRDVWVIGYNNSYVSEQTFPRLTSVDSRMEDVGAECARRLDKAIQGCYEGDRIFYIDPYLVIKESSHH